MRVIIVALVAVSLSGCLQDFDAPGSVDIIDLEVSAPKVTSGTVDLVLHVDLDIVDAPTKGLEAVATATDTRTGLLTSNTTVDLGTFRKDQTTRIDIPLSVPRQSDYRLEVKIKESGVLIETAAVTLRNVDRLPVNLFDIGVQISEIDFLVAGVSGGRADIEATLYVTNEAGGPSQPLRIQLKAIEVSTGLLADEEWIDLPSIHVEETHPFTAALSMPDDFNYRVEAVIWQGNFIVERGQGFVQLAPTFVRPADSTLELSNPDISQFVRGGAGGGSFADDGHADEGTQTPALGLLTVLAALAALAILRRRP